jgi:NAD(P)-dependent dehydrogenase (short-subunit alcohol dehydrogenase family)
MSMTSLAGKTALITGGTQGVGAGIARRFAAAGARVAVCGRSAAKGERMTAAMAELGYEVVFFPVDLADLSSCAEVVDQALALFGRLDILVNSAADTRRSDIRSVSADLILAQMAVNVAAPLLLIQRALPALRQAQGVVINIGSVNAYIGQSHLLAYSASKGALMTASRNLAHALRGERIRVHCLNLGWTDTEGEREIQAREGQPADFLDRVAREQPLGRLLIPKDIAEVCLMLAGAVGAAFSGMVLDLAQSPVGALPDPVRPGGR